MTYTVIIFGIIFVYGIVMEIRDYRNNDKCGCGSGPGAAFMHEMYCVEGGYCKCNACLRRHPESGGFTITNKSEGGLTFPK